MTNTSTNAIIIDREAFITNFLQETVFFFTPLPLLAFPEAKRGYKLTCKMERISFWLQSQSRSTETGHFSPQVTPTSPQWTMSRTVTEWALNRGWSQTEASQWHPQGRECRAALMKLGLSQSTITWLDWLGVKEVTTSSVESEFTCLSSGRSTSGADIEVYHGRVYSIPVIANLA